jgi:hypothetical protein
VILEWQDNVSDTEMLQNGNGLWRNEGGGIKKKESEMNCFVAIFKQ